MSFALRSAAVVRLFVDASFWHCTRERPTLLNFALRLAVGGLASMEVSCSLSLSLPTQARLLEICNIVPVWDCAAVCLWQLSARGRASVCSGPFCESSAGPSVPILALVLQLHNGFLCNFDLFLKLFVITSTRSFQDVRIPLVTCLVSNSRCKFGFFRTEITLSSCKRASVSVSKGCNAILLVTEMIQICSVTILLFAGER